MPRSAASPSVAAAGHASQRERFIALVLIVLGVTLRVWVRTPIDFWEDEIIAATHAVQPFWQVIIDSLRNDTHPPLYFLQLHVWALFGHSDFWLMLNSVAWSLAALGSVWWVVKSQYGDRVALFAAAIFSILPSPVYMAAQLRMSGMHTTLIVWAYYLGSQIFGEGRATKATLIFQGALLFSIVNIHAIGFLAVLLNGMYALYLTMSQPRDRRKLGFWVTLYGIAAICAVPWLISGMLHDANLHEESGFNGLLNVLSSTVIGIIDVMGQPLRIFGAVIYLAVATLGILSQRTRALTCTFLILPIVLSILTALVLTPIFKWNIFSTIEAPFIALVLALLVADTLGRHSPRIILSGLCVIALLGVSVATRLTFIESSGYRYLARFIRANYQAGDIVYVPQQSNFWGLAWYLEGPEWGSPLTVAAPPSAQWQSLYAKLGQHLVAVLGLMPKTQMLRGHGVKAALNWK